MGERDDNGSDGFVVNKIRDQVSLVDYLEVVSGHFRLVLHTQRFDLDALLVAHLVHGLSMLNVRFELDQFRLE